MIERELLHFGYAFIFLAVLVEGDATLLTAAFLAHRGYFQLPIVILVAAASTFCANQAFNYIARRNGAEWIEKKAAANKRLGRVIGWTRRRGVLLLLASRFMPGCRTMVPMVCGVNGMAPLRFLGWNATGAVIWAAAFGAAGYAGSNAIPKVLPDFREHELAIAVVVFVVVVAVVYWKTRRR